MTIEKNQFEVKYGEGAVWRAGGDLYSTQVNSEESPICQLLWTIGPNDPLNICIHPRCPQCDTCDIATRLPDRLKRQIIETTKVYPLM